MRSLTILVGLFLLSGCTSMKSVRSPDFYPNAHLERVGSQRAHQDTRYCMSLADDYIKEPEHWKNVLETTAESAILGTATGAVGGSIVSNAGRGAGIGAATGAIVGLYRGLRAAGEPNPSYERFVEACLADKGYKVYGWS